MTETPKLLNCAVCGWKTMCGSCSNDRCGMYDSNFSILCWNALQSLVKAARKMKGTMTMGNAIRRFDKAFGVKEKK